AGARGSRRAACAPDDSAQALRHLREQPDRLGIRIVTAPRIEPGASEVDVGLDLLRDLLGGADEVAFPPRLGRFAPERLRPGVDALLLGLGEEALGRDRLAALVVVAADVGAVPLEPLGFVLPLVRLATEVRGVGVTRDPAQRELLAAPADQDLG